MMFPHHWLFVLSKELYMLALLRGNCRDNYSVYSSSGTGDPRIHGSVPVVGCRQSIYHISADRDLFIFLL